MGDYGLLPLLSWEIEADKKPRFGNCSGDGSEIGGDYVHAFVARCSLAKSVTIGNSSRFNRA